MLCFVVRALWCGSIHEPRDNEVEQSLHGGACRVSNGSWREMLLAGPNTCTTC